jgi:hypothetical protein
LIIAVSFDLVRCAAAEEKQQAGAVDSLGSSRRDLARDALCVTYFRHAQVMGRLQV